MSRGAHGVTPAGCLPRPQLGGGRFILAINKRLTPQHPGRAQETVALVSGLPPARLDARHWLQANCQSRCVENGLHQRLDSSLNDDRRRVRGANGLWVRGMFRRLLVSHFIAWRRRHAKPQHQAVADFHAAMGEDNLAKAISFVSAKGPKL